MPRVFCVLTLLLLICGTVSAQPTLRITRVPEPPRFEDYLDGVAPDGQQPITGFIQREPADGKPATQKTEAYVSYDDRHLYVIFVARDADPSQVRARLTRREDFMGDDIVGVILDTFHDRRRGYEFLVNPHGIQLDGVVAEGQDDDFSFDTLWKSQGQLTPFGYVVRLEIPFRSLRFSGEPKQTWGIALARIVPRANETSFWPTITNRVAGFVQQMATLEGLEGISPGRNIQLIPYGAFAGVRFLEPDGNGYATDRDGRAGLDAKVVLKDAFTLDVALNPDFSQVESDEPQVTTNQRFEVFFPERRPFFIENAPYFETPINLVFSRRIADPQFGARVTGKAGGWALGAIAIDDRAPGRRVAPGSSGFGDRAGIGIVRAQREFGEQSTIGFLATSRDFGPSFSRVASLDGRVKLNENWIAQGQLALSRTATGGSPAATGSALDARISRRSRTYGYSAQYTDIDPDFRVPLGFVRRVDIRELEQDMYRTWWPSGGGPVLRFGPQVNTSVNWDHSGRLQDWLFSPEFSAEFRGQTEIEIDFREEFELFEGIEFRKREAGINLQTEWLRWLSASISVESGSDINYFPGPGIAPFLANSREAAVSVTLRPLSRLRLEQRYLYSALSLRDAVASTPLERPGSSIFDEHLFRTRVNYQFTRELSLRAILDYSRLTANPLLIGERGQRDLTGDVLFTYLLNPGTAVYVGYTDRYAGEELDDFVSGRTPRSRLRSTGRQIFVKASYLLRF